MNNGKGRTMTSTRILDAELERAERAAEYFMAIVPDAEEAADGTKWAVPFGRYAVRAEKVGNADGWVEIHVHDKRGRLVASTVV